MLNNEEHRQAGGSMFMSSTRGFANTVAAAATFFGAPELWRRTVAYVRVATFELNGPGWVDFATIAWFLICVALVFYLSRMTIGTALVFGGLAIVTRFM